MVLSRAFPRVIHRFWGLTICDGSGQSQLADAKVKSLARENLGRARDAQSGVATLPAGGTLVGLGSAKLGCAGRGCVSELRSSPAAVVRPQGIKVGQACRADRPSTPSPPSAPVTEPVPHSLASMSPAWCSMRPIQACGWSNIQGVSVGNGADAGIFD